MKYPNALLASVILGAAFIFTQCTDDDALNSQLGTLVLKITDAASDDENIKGIFITVAGIKLDGKPLRNFIPQTIEISNLKNGQTGLLIEKELTPKTYERISLVLTAEAVNKEDMPGCYVLTTNNLKHNLFPEGSNSNTIEISATKSFELLPAQESHIVIDFNLRKAVVRNPAEIGSYRFVTPPELEKALRLIPEETSGAIAGEVLAKDFVNTNFYVYVYRKEEFDASVEGTGQGKSKVLFTNSVTEARVEPDGSYFIPFVEQGEYDIHLATFKRNSHNVFTFYGFARTTSKRTGMLLKNVSVSPGAETELNIDVYRLL